MTDRRERGTIARRFSPTS